MKLVDYEIIPSVVQDAKDPECLGRVKCVIPGKIHHDSTKTTEHMPWVRPFKMGGYQTFSKEIEGHKVWVLHNKQNYNEYWYIPIHEPINITQDFLKEHYEDHPEVLLARNLGAEKVMMRYDDITGYMYEIGDQFINLMPNGQYDVKGADGRIAIDQSIVKLGSWSDREYEPALKGKKWEKNRSDLADDFTKLSGVCPPQCKAIILKIIKHLMETGPVLAKNTHLN